MKKIIFFLSMVFLASFSYSQTNNICLSQRDAEKILGLRARITENTSAVKNEIKEQRCTYSANSGGDKVSNLYCLLEEYRNEEAAHNAYMDIMSRNSNMSGLKKIDNIGNEAFIHSDNANFLLINCRKKNKMLRLKVNKLTPVTSYEEMQKTARKLL